jgi:hypothetical protein
MSADADHVWQRAVDDARPRPRELHRAELGLHRPSSPGDLQWVARVPRLTALTRWTARRSALWLLLSMAGVGGAWGASGAIWPAQRATSETHLWASATATCGNTKLSARERFDACPVVDDYVFSVVSSTRALLSDESVGDAVRAARTAWSEVLRGTDAAGDASACADPLAELATLNSTGLPRSSRLRALEALRQAVSAGLVLIRDVTPPDGDSEGSLRDITRRLEEALQ